jgi:hypothetical protein
MPQEARKKRENPNATVKGRVATSRTTEPRLVRPKRAALAVITSYFLNLDRLLIFSLVGSTAAAKSLISLMKAMMMTVMIPHPKLMKRSILSLNWPSP